MSWIFKFEYLHLFLLIYIKLLQLHYFILLSLVYIRYLLSVGNLCVVLTITDHVKICNALCLFLFIPYNNICCFWRSVMNTNDHCIISAINILMEKNSLCFNVLVLKQCRGAVNKETILFSQLLEVKYSLHVERHTVIPNNTTVSEEKNKRPYCIGYQDTLNWDKL